MSSVYLFALRLQGNLHEKQIVIHVVIMHATCVFGCEYSVHNSQMKMKTVAGDRCRISELHVGSFIPVVGGLTTIPLKN